MKKQCSGFIFLMTLSVILVVSLLLMTCLHQVLLYHKALNLQEMHHQNFYHLEDLAVQLARTGTTHDMSCVERSDVANEIIQRLMSNQGCSFTEGGARYRYLIEDLGDFPCLMLSSSKRASHHSRITLLLWADDTASVLQLRFIGPAAAAIPCMGKVHRISEGVSSWRYIPALSK